jgi:hypothetical protein
MSKRLSTQHRTACVCMYIMWVESWCGTGTAPEEEFKNGLSCLVKCWHYH